MKILFTGLFVLSLCYVQAAKTPPELAAKIEEFKKVCAEKTSVDPDLVTKFRNGEFNDDEKLKEYVYCVTRKHGLQNENGDVQAEALKTIIGIILGDQAKSVDAFNKCGKAKSTGIESAFTISQCYYGIFKKMPLF